MLIEFRLRNFRSFRDIAEVNFTASADKELERTHCILTGVSSTPRVTRTAAVFGANASGKSNLMFGLATMNLLVQHSTALSETQFAEFYTPFKLDPATVGGPTEFEVNVVISGVRYEYGFSHDAHRIRSEWLTVYRTAKGQRAADGFEGAGIIDAAADGADALDRAAVGDGPTGKVRGESLQLNVSAIGERLGNVERASGDEHRVDE